MRSRPRVGGALAVGGLVLLLTLLPSALPGVEVRDRAVYVEGDSIRLDARLDSLFSPRVLDAIASGMTTSIGLFVRIERRGAPVTVRWLSVRIDHDIWEGRYRVVRGPSLADTLDTASFDEMARRAGAIERLSLGPLPPGDEEHLLRLRSDVNPISPEQRERTRRWLNLLERGSLLELFINLDPPLKEGGWIDVARFRPKSLPAPAAEDPR